MIRRQIFSLSLIFCSAAIADQGANATYNLLRSATDHVMSAEKVLFQIQIKVVGVQARWHHRRGRCFAWARSPTEGRECFDRETQSGLGDFSADQADCDLALYHVSEARHAIDAAERHPMSVEAQRLYSRVGRAIARSETQFRSLCGGQTPLS